MLYAERGIVMTSRLSVRLYVTLRFRDHIGWNSSKIILRSDSGVFALSKHQHHGFTPNGTPEMFAGLGVGWAKMWLSACQSSNTCISEMRQDSTKVRTNRKSYIRAFDRCQNQRPWTTLKGHYAFCFKTHASFGAHSENLKEDRSILSATKMIQWL